MDRFSDHEHFRSSMVDDLRRQLLGPLSYDNDEDKNEILPISPLQLYATGVLFPQKLQQEILEDSKPEKSVDESNETEGDLENVNIKKPKAERGNFADEGATSQEREPLNLANEFSPSACGISFRLEGAENLLVALDYGTYSPSTRAEVNPRAGEIGLDGKPRASTRNVVEYHRAHHRHVIPVSIPNETKALPPIFIESQDSGLKLHVTVRRRTDHSLVVSCMAVNHKSAGQKTSPSNEDAFFQVSLVVRQSENNPVFVPIDRDAGGTDDEELASMDLLFRHRRAFALGHGVAGDWNRDELLSESGKTNMVCSAALPNYDLKPIKPREKPFKQSELNLSMGFLYDADGHTDPEPKIIETLHLLTRDYADWIGSVEKTIESLEPRLKVAAEKNLANCRSCQSRMVRGIEVLGSNKDAMLAFRLMNKAMLVQQIHSQLLPPRELGTPYPTISKDYKNPPGGPRKWRPFQLGFILMNIAGMVAADEPERDLVDLIWFPTGGGKTEAYLGLAAFTICLNRLAGSVTGAIVIMRYTLRLLTAQQFQRASALVCALEVMRRDRDLEANLGSDEISIGLWVGKTLSPNTRADAKAALDKLRQDEYAPNPFQVLRCPWCGVNFTNRRKLGYQDVRVTASTERSVRFVCPDDDCRFGKNSNELPIQVVDEEIYAKPPTIIIGTVDKFAQLAWDDRVGRLFGLGIDAPPPALIIQDELHLISGPLGTIVGLYETAIDRLCSRDGHKSKIVASTATIRRAQQQCRDLYARAAFEFPPQAVRAGESYFAFEDRESPGRLYVGFMGTAVKSHQTALVRACSPLLQSACQPIEESEAQKRDIVDPYGTLVWYFNSLRELGHAATLCVGDIPEFLKGLCHRLQIPYENRRYIREIIELTSRCNADEIPSILQQLEIPWRTKPGNKVPVDILLATNMIAVGVDVSRLGLIVMSGQPKGTSEYIQATSRVGRMHPGLVLTVYTQTKSRDRSHYERFVAYHQSLYRHVEPTSVTPFSPQARDRGMRGVLVALARLLAGVTAPNMISAQKAELEVQIDAIRSRIKAVDGDELDESLAEIEEWIEFWQEYAPQEYGRMGGTPTSATLAYPFGTVPDPLYQRDAWPLMTSMRNVDGTCAARVLNTYEFGTEQDQVAD